MHLSKTKILGIYPWLMYIKSRQSDPVMILEIIQRIVKELFPKVSKTAKEIINADTEPIIQELLQPLTKPHFRFHNIWFVNWRMPFVRVKLLKENLADLPALDYAMATVFLIMYNGAIENKQSPELILKLQSQFIGHTLRGAWWKISDENRYAIAKRIIKKQPQLAMYLSDYYADSLEKVMRMYPDVFNADNEGRTLYQNGEGCIAMLEEIAANHTFGDFDKVSAIPVHTLFLYLKHQAIKVKAEQQRNANQQ
jgi:hypothetical protein